MNSKLNQNVSSKSSWVFALFLIFLFFKKISPFLLWDGFTRTDLTAPYFTDVFALVEATASVSPLNSHPLKWKPEAVGLLRPGTVSVSTIVGMKGELLSPFGQLQLHNQFGDEANGKKTKINVDMRDFSSASPSISLCSRCPVNREWRNNDDFEIKQWQSK